MWQLTKQKSWAELQKQFNFVADMSGVEQDPIYHAEGDVAIHTEMVLDALCGLPEYQQLPQQQQEIVWSAALFHDVEKRSTTRQDFDGRIVSPGHAKKGELTTRQLLFRHFDVPFMIREQISALVRYHGLPLWILEKTDPQRAVLAAALRVDMPLLAMLAKADILGRHCQDQNELLTRIELFKLYCQEQNCWHHPRHFASPQAQFHYFHNENSSIDYEPYEQDTCQVIMLCGLPGMGKDHFIQQHYPDKAIVSLDNIRREFNIRPSDKNANGWVVQQAIAQAKTYLRANQDFIWNATSLGASLRNKMISLFARYQAEIELIYLEMPYEQWQQQNRQREYAVPNSVLERMLTKLEMPTPDEAHRVFYYVNRQWVKLKIEE